MNIIRVLVAIVLMVFGVITTVGSGGGGGGGGPIMGAPVNPDLPPVEFDYVEINAANAQDVASEVVKAAALVTDISNIIAGQIVPGPASNPSVLSSNSKFDSILDVATNGSSMTVPCLLSGTVFILPNAANNSAGFSESDFFTLTFNACDDGDRNSIDGEITFRVGEITGDPLTDVFRLRYGGGTELTVTVGATSYFAPSGFFLSWDTVNFPLLSLEVSNIQFVIRSAIDYIFRGLSQQLDLDTAVTPAAQQWWEEGVSVETDTLGGVVEYRSVAPLDGLESPSVGEIMIEEGNDDGNLRLVIESAATVRLEVDEDGDGILEDVQFTTWAALLN